MAALKYWDGAAWKSLGQADIVEQQPPGMSMSGGNTAVAGSGAAVALSAPTLVNRQSPAGSLSGAAWTVPETGLYRIFGWMQYIAANVNTYAGIRVYVNGVNQGDLLRLANQTTSQYPHATGHWDMNLTAGQVLTFILQHGDSVARDLLWRFAVDLLPSARGPQGPAGDVTVNHSTGTDFTTPAVDFTPTTSFSTCGWFSTIAAGPDQEWDLFAAAQVLPQAATWGISRAQFVVQNGSGGAAPAGVSLDFIQVNTVPVNSAYPGISHVVGGRLVTTPAFSAQNLRLLLQFLYLTTATKIHRDGNYFQIRARRMK